MSDEWCVEYSKLITSTQKLKYKATFACGLGELFDRAVILVTVAVENNRFDTLIFGALRDNKTDDLGGFTAAFATLNLRGHISLQRCRRDQRLAARIVNHLRVNVTQRAIDAQARALRRAFDFLSQAQMTAHSHVV
jgi:hypothetical protein